jgi:hypothetical protein
MGGGGPAAAWSQGLSAGTTEPGESPGSDASPSFGLG